MATDNHTIAILQPSYMPWLGYMDQIASSDDFIFYDDVQYDKNGWRNRNRFKDTNGTLQWLTVPVHHKNNSKAAINEIKICDNVDWRRKQIRSIEQSYNKAPYFEKYWPDIKSILNQEWSRLLDLNLAVIRLAMDIFAIDTPTHLSSELNIQGDRNERILNICKHFKATNYLSGDSAKNYLDENLFNENQINVIWQNYQHPTYPQLHGEFIPQLCILDLIFNTGEDSKNYFTKRS